MKSEVPNAADRQEGTQKEFTYRDLKPNPLNPRRLFDRQPLDVLKESIRKNGILVPLTVYLEPRNRQHYIIDGERRWRCAEELEKDPEKPQAVKIPANIVDPPSKVANVLWMFNIHNLREQWELMPTALSLKLVMEDLKETDEYKLAQLTQLSEPHVRRCKVLLSFPKKYQDMMLDPDPARRIKANFFIELKPVLDLYEKLPKRCSAGKDRNGLTDHFLSLYIAGKISSVIHFRRVLEADDYLREGEREDEFEAAAQTLATDSKATIRKLFDPLVREDRTADSAEDACRQFLKSLRTLKIENTTRKRIQLRKLLIEISQHARDLAARLEG